MRKTPKSKESQRRGSKSAGADTVINDRNRRRVEELSNEDEYLYSTQCQSEENISDAEIEDDSEILNKVANRTYFVVVVYDIVDNRRRSKLAKLLLSYGDRVQYSSFEGHLSKKQLEALTIRIAKLIDESDDKVRIYKIAGTPQLKVFGSVPFREDESFVIL